MAEGSGGQDRTEQPTSRRWGHARAEGKVARSTELSAAAVLLSGALVFSVAGGASFGSYALRLMHQSAALLSSEPLGAAGAAGILRFVAGSFVAAFLPFGIGVLAVVLLVNLIQAKGTFSWSPATPRLSNIDPLSGLKRIFRSESLFQILRSVIKLAILTIVAYTALKHSLPALTSLTGAGAGEILHVTRSLILRLAFTVGLAFLGLAGFDYAYQVYRFGQSLKMTRQEVLQDMRESEGDPRVKARMLGVARALARRRMLQKVPQADVVIVNPTEIAVALKYDVAIAPAPVVLAMGQRKLAERIRAIARRAEVPVVENRGVARALLATAQVGRPIPPALYAAVAEILAFVYRLRRGRSALPGERARRSLP